MITAIASIYYSISAERRRYLFGINSEGEGGIKGSGHGSIGGVFSAISDVANTITVDSDAGNGSVDLKPGLQVKDRTL